MGKKTVTETRFGNTLIIVTGECSPTATETIEKKLERLILRHVSDLKSYQDDNSTKHIPNRPYTMWHTSVVSDILANREYTGTAILNRQTSKSYKDHRKYIKPEEEWIIHENAHPAIIDAETFETVQRIRSNRRRITKKTYEKGPLEGMIYCPDCGDRLYAKRNSRKNNDGTVKEYCYYICKNSRTYSDIPTCTPHAIMRETLDAAVLQDLQRVIKLAKTDERKFAEKLNAASQKETERGTQKAKGELAKANNRIYTLDRIISKIYEDNVTGKISDERFQNMLAGYETEQTDLKTKVEELESLVTVATQRTTNMEIFLRLVHAHTEVTELTADIVHEFINRIEVSEAEYTPARFSHWARGKTQKVKIIYNYLDDINAKLKEE